MSHYDAIPRGCCVQTTTAWRDTLALVCAGFQHSLDTELLKFTLVDSHLPFVDIIADYFADIADD